MNDKEKVEYFQKEMEEILRLTTLDEKGMMDFLQKETNGDIKAEHFWPFVVGWISNMAKHALDKVNGVEMY
ncbi:MAG: hypothetical protein LUG62_05560 [Clostridiales bacterium]|nr:hypothetical protein [Clostridiales bacterium]